MTIQLALFDYTALDTETRIVVQQRTTEIKALMKRAASDIIEIGQKLIEVKERLGHGDWEPWLKTEFDWSYPTAARFMQVGRAFNQSYQIDNFAPSALYLLAAPSTPESARLEALERAEQGEPITHSTAKAIVSDHLPHQCPYCNRRHNGTEISGVKQCPHCGMSHSYNGSKTAQFAPVPGYVAPVIPITPLPSPSPEPVPVFRPTIAPDPSPLPFVPDYTDFYGDDASDDSDVETPVATSATTVYAPAVLLPSLASHQLINASTSNEWYTPAHFIEAARVVMGGIDLDPATCEFANRIVQASSWYGLDHPDMGCRDGLAHPWQGRVWLNPPYGKDDGESNQAIWSRRLIDAYTTGQIEQAVLLVNAVPGNAWFVPLKRYPICFPDSRIRFYNEQVEAGQPTHSNALVYFGPHRDRFAEIFSRFGAVMAIREVWQ